MEETHTTQFDQELAGLQEIMDRAGQSALEENTSWETWCSRKLETQLKGFPDKWGKQITFLQHKIAAETSPLAKCLLETRLWLLERGTPQCDFWHYTQAFIKSRGEHKMPEDFFNGDVEYLRDSYKKMLKEYQKEGKFPYKYSLKAWQQSCYYAMLKLRGVYDPYEMDPVFLPQGENAKRDSREHNTTIRLPRPLREEIPFETQTWDIKAAYPSFTSHLLQTPMDPNIYEKMQKAWKCTRQEAKLEINILLNRHDKTRKPLSYEFIIWRLLPIWPNIEELMTRERYSDKGSIYRLFSLMETDVVERFVQANGISNYVRLHDAVMFSAHHKVKETTTLLKNEETGFTTEIKWEKKVAKENPDVKTHWENLVETIAGPKVKIDSERLKEWLAQYSIETWKNELSGAKPIMDYIHLTEEVKGIFRIRPVEIIQDEMKEKNKIPLFSYEEGIKKTDPFRTDLVNTLATKSGKEYFEGVIKHCALPHKGVFTSNEAILIPTKRGLLKVTADNVEQDSGNKTIVKNEIRPYSGQETFLNHGGDFDFIKYCASIGYKKLIGPTDKFEIPTEFGKPEDKGWWELVTLIGLLLHRPSSRKKEAVIFTDALEEGEDTIDYETRKDGGRGKSIFGQILSQIISLEHFSTGEVLKGRGKTTSKEEVGLSLAPAYAGLGILFCDELTSHEVLDSYFEAITGDMPVRRMFKNTNYIKALEKPRLVFCTNSLFIKEGRSFSRRYIEYELPPIFGGKKGLDPELVYGRLFFSEKWSNQDWECFMGFIVYCVQSYLKWGYQAQEHDKELKVRAAYSKEATMEKLEKFFEVSYACESWRQSGATELIIRGTMDIVDFIKEPAIMTHNNCRKYLDSFLKHYGVECKSHGKRGIKICTSYRELVKKIHDKDMTESVTKEDMFILPQPSKAPAQDTSDSLHSLFNELDEYLKK